MRTDRFPITAAFFLLLAGLPASAAELEKFLPKETDIVVSFNVRQLLDSAVVKQNALDLIKTTLSGNEKFQELVKLSGLDPLKDIEALHVGVSLDNLKSPKLFALATGRWDVKKLTDTLDLVAKDDPKKIATVKVNNRTVYKFVNSDQTETFAAVLNAETMVLSTSKEAVANAYDAAQGTRKPEIKKELAELLAKADSKTSLRIVMLVRGNLEKLPLPDPSMKKSLEQIYSLTLDIKAERNVDLELSIGVENGEVAKMMEPLATAGIELVKAQVKVAILQQPELQPIQELANSLLVSTRGKAIFIAGKIKGESIEKAMKNLK